MISYDLIKPGQDYSGLIKSIKNCGVWWHHLKSTWLVDSSLNINTINDRLLKQIDKNDNLLIFEVTEKYQGWLSQRALDWIAKHTK